MVKSIGVGNYRLRPEDYATAVRFFRSIGCDSFLAKGVAGFFAPRGRLTIRALRPGELLEQKGDWATGVNVQIHVSNLDVVRNVADSMHLKVGPRDKEFSGFAVRLAGALTVFVNAYSEEPLPEIKGGLSGSRKKFGVVVSRFNSFITDRLLQGAVDGLVRSGAKDNDIAIVRVPGAFEIPSAARTLAKTKKYDAIICLGCLIRGDTAHYDVIVNEVTRGIGQSAQETGVPHAFGVLTCDNLEQAIDRAGLKMGNKGLEAALAAVEMANLTPIISNKRTDPQASAIGPKGRASKKVSSKKAGTSAPRKHNS